MDKIVTINGAECTLRANALLPRKYRHFFNRDLVADMKRLQKKYEESEGEDFDAEVLENLTWLMLKEGGEDVGRDPEEWLAGIDDMLEIYQLQPEIVGLWARSQVTTAIPKKK